MNKSQSLIESITDLLEHNPFKKHGYDLDKHIYLSPRDKKLILKRRKRVGDKIKDNLPREKKRIMTIYHHEGQHYGAIEHQTAAGHPLDIHYYLLNKRIEK